MIPITISRASHDLLEAHAAGWRVLGGVDLPDGRVLIEVEHDTLAALNAIDPDHDRAIAQLCSTGVGHA